MLSQKKVLIGLDDLSQNGVIHLISSKLNHLLEENNISTKALSEATGLSVAAINNLKRAEGNPTIGTLSTLSKFFGISLIEMLGLSGLNNMQKQTTIVELYDLRFANKRSEETMLKKMLIEIPPNTDPNTLFGIVLNNSSLLPIYEKGTNFILTASQVALDGDITLVRIRDQVNSLKRLFIKQESFYLKNINIDDSIERYDKDDIEILGIVIQIIQKQYE